MVYYMVFVFLHYRINWAKSNTALWQITLRDSQREEVLLCMLRLSHTNLTHSSYAGTSAPISEPCKIQLTVFLYSKIAPHTPPNEYNFHFYLTFGKYLGDHEPMITDRSTQFHPILFFIPWILISSWKSTCF